MSVVPVKDDDGLTMDLMIDARGGYQAEGAILDTVNNSKDLPLNSDDIMLCSYPKSGSHWVYEILNHLINERQQMGDIPDKESQMIERNSFEQLSQIHSPRILNNHLLFEDQPRDLTEKHVKIIFVYRNIKDVAVSFFHHHTKWKMFNYSATFSQYLRRFVSGKLDSGGNFEYLKSWEEGIQNNPGLNIHVVSYEEIKQNPDLELKRLSKFIGASTDESFLQSVKEKTSFQKMKAIKSKNLLFLDEKGEHIMYRKGEVGDWKNHFLPAESKWFDELIEKELGRSKIYKFQYSL